MKKLLTTIICSLTMLGASAQNWVQRTYPAAASADGAFAFAINDKIYVGGGLGSKQLWEYTPATGAWVQKGNVPGVITDRSFATATAMDGKGYAGLGIDGSATKKTDFWQYNPSDDTWRRMTTYPGSGTDGLFCFPINGKIYMGGGEDAITGAQNQEVYAFDPVDNTWTQKNDYPYSGTVFPFSFVANNKGYISAGAEGSGVVCRTLQYDPTQDVWTSKTDYPGSARLAGVAFWQGGKVLCGSGMDGVDFYSNFYSYNPSDDSWTAQADMPGSKRAFGVAAATATRSFAGLGWSGSSTVQRDFWEFNAPTGVNNATINASAIGYPNPAGRQLFIRHDETTPVTIRINDYSGKLVLEEGGVTSGKSIDVSQLAAGSYLLNIIKATGALQSQALTIVHD